MDTSETSADSFQTLVVRTGASPSSPFDGSPTVSLDQLTDSSSWAARLNPAHGPVLLVDDRMEEDALQRVIAQLPMLNSTHLFVVRPSQRNWLIRLLSWLQLCLNFVIFGLRKSPSDAAALWIPDPQTLLSRALSSQREPALPWGLGWLVKRFHVQAFPTHGWDRYLQGLSVTGPLAQSISASSTHGPSLSGWWAYGTLMIQSIVTGLMTVRDGWNWRLFSTANPWSLPGMMESSKPDSRTADPSGLRWSTAGSWLAAAFLLISGVGVISYQLNYPLFEPDEARNAQLAINIIESGNWVSLTLGPEPYWDKPPAVAWGTAMAFQWFGIHAWSARLVSAVSAVLTLLLTFYFGRRWVGPRAAFLGAFLLLLCIGFVICGRYATMDAAITLCAVTMLGSMYSAVAGPRFHYGFWLLASLVCGVGLLVKGPVIGVLTLPPFLLWLWFQRNTRLWKPAPWLVMGTVALSVAGPWFVIMGITEPEFLVYFFWKHHVLRFSDAFNHREPFWFYLPVLLLGTFPASLLVPTLVPLFRKQGAAYRQAMTPQAGLLVLYAAWVIGFFSLSDSKLPTYIMPAFPAVALLYATAAQAMLIEASQQAAPLGRFQRYFLSIPKRAAVSVVIAIVAFSVASLLVFRQNAWTGSFIPVAGFGLVLSLLAWFLHQHRTVVTRVSLALGLLFVITIIGYVLPGISTFRSIRRAAAQIRQDPQLQDLPIVFYNHENYGCQLWLDEDSTASFDDYNFLQMLTYLQRHPRCLIVSKWDEMEVLRSNMDPSVELSSIKGARHVYLCQPKSTPRTEVQQIADRLQPVTFTR